LNSISHLLVAETDLFNDERRFGRGRNQFFKSRFGFSRQR
jgi:hypothetical protein